MKINLLELCNLNIVIPNYQREYQWSKELVLDLINTCNDKDLTELIDNEGNTRGFPGMIQAVLSKSIDEDGQTIIDITRIVDGQQRITTFKLIELAIMCIENQNINDVLNVSNKLIVHKFQQLEYDDFKDYLQGIKEYSHKNIYIRNFKYAKDYITKLNLNNFKTNFNAIEINIRYEKLENENKLYLILNNNSLPLTLEEKHRSILLKNEKNDELISLYRNILEPLNDISINKNKENDFGKHLVEFLFIEYYEDFNSKFIGSFNSIDTYQKIINLLLNKITTKELSKNYMKDFSLYLQCVKISSTKELINYIGQKLYNEVDNFGLNSDTANLILALTLYNLKKKYPIELDKVKSELIEVVETILIPYCFNIFITDKKPFITYNVGEVKSLYRNYFIISNKNKKSIFDTLYYEFILQTFRDRKNKKEMINYVNSSVLEYHDNGNSNIRKALSYLYKFHNDDCSLEHIIPQSFYKDLENLTKDEWLDKYHDINKETYMNIPYENFRQAVYSIGNFALFSQGLNSSLGNKPPKTKAELILKKQELSGFTTITLNHSDAKNILDNGLDFSFIEKRKENIRKLILNKINSQVEQSDQYIYDIKTLIDNEDNRKIEEEKINKEKEKINDEIKFDFSLISDIAVELIEENYKKQILVFDHEKLFDKLKLEPKYNKILNRARNNGLEFYFNDLFKDRITKQITLVQLYHFVIEILNNKGYKVKLFVSGTIDENVKISQSDSLKRKFDRIRLLNEVIENATNNNIVIVGKLNSNN